MFAVVLLKIIFECRGLQPWSCPSLPGWALTSDILNETAPDWLGGAVQLVAAVYWWLLGLRGGLTGPGAQDMTICSWLRVFLSWTLMTSINNTFRFLKNNMRVNLTQNSSSKHSHFHFCTQQRITKAQRANINDTHGIDSSPRTYRDHQKLQFIELLLLLLLFILVIVDRLDLELGRHWTQSTKSSSMLMSLPLFLRMLTNKLERRGGTKSQQLECKLSFQHNCLKYTQRVWWVFSNGGRHECTVWHYENHVGLF